MKTKQNWVSLRERERINMSFHVGPVTEASKKLFHLCFDVEMSSFDVFTSTNFGLLKLMIGLVSSDSNA